MTPRDDGIQYRLNDRDEIVFVNEAWDTFASTNAAEHLTAPTVVGRSLWEFMADDTTRLLYRDVLARVRGGRAVRFVFRCDSPDCRRRLEMEVGRVPDGLVEFRVRTRSEEKRPPQPLLDPDRAHSEALLRVCGWCKKVDVGGEWAEVEDAISRNALFEQPLLPEVTHGICERCYSRMVATLREDKGSAGPGGPRTGSGRDGGADDGDDRGSGIGPDRPVQRTAPAGSETSPPGWPSD